MKVEIRQAFETLGVPVGSHASDVRSAYRTLIRSNHPDHVTGDAAAATQRLAEINAAKDLIDRTSMASPDRPRHAANSQAQPTRTKSEPLTPVQLRARREAEARAFRKAKEARANAELHAALQSRARADQATAARGFTTDLDDAEKRACEDARLRRQAAFAAAARGEKTNEARGSLFRRLRTFGSR